MRLSFWGDERIISVRKSANKGLRVFLLRGVKTCDSNSSRSRVTESVGSEWTSGEIGKERERDRMRKQLNDEKKGKSEQTFVNRKCILIIEIRKETG